MLRRCPNAVWWIMIEASKLVKVYYAPVDDPHRALNTSQTFYTELFTQPDRRNRKVVAQWKADWVYVT